LIIAGLSLGCAQRTANTRAGAPNLRERNERSGVIDQYASLAAPVAAVFTRLADPARLGDWLPQVTRVELESGHLIGIGLAFAVITDVTGDQLLPGEVASHEPPWLVAYRLMMTGPMLIRATCTAHAGGTRVHVRQTDAADLLQVDLSRLQRALHGTCATGASAARADHSGNRSGAEVQIP
jgi:uncharacterized protein YndB with AHSA1/START domain